MKRRSLAELRERARRELSDNPTITVYTFRNGVEQRHAANPWAGFKHALKQFSIRMERFGDEVRTRMFEGIGPR